ncbi:MAG: ABC transporter substrate-binding protein [Flavobacteriales bacterium]|nr:ABC transporter substrate-binding protein [Flavobacteriales bacterium]MCB9448794.1 ABC transporter substrate-binding protein [Flavobacteriales bacterium]
MKTLLYSFFCVFLGLLSVGCGGGGKAPAAKEHKTVFRYNEAAGISTLDPAFARDQAIIWAVHQIYDGLVQLDDTLRVQPAIAKSWKVDKKGLQYTFTLRNDVYFHDSPVFPGGIGRKVVASDFVYSFNRIVDDRVASPGLWVFQNIERDAEGHLSGLVAMNDSTLKITLSKSYPPFLGMLSMPYCYVVPREAVEKYGSEFGRNPVGTGPFYFKLWKDGMRLVLHRNPSYFETDSAGNRLPYLDAVAISFIKDKQIAYMEFLKGNFDFLSGVEASYKDELLTLDGRLRNKFSDRFYMLTTPYLNTEYLGFLMDTTFEAGRTSPFRNKKVRQAMNYGFNRRKMIKYLRNNIGTPGEGGFIPKGLPGYISDSTAGYTYDPVKAARLLVEAGYPGGKGLPVIRLSTTGSYLNLCEAMQNELGEIGVDIKLEVNTSATHREMVSKSKLAFFRGSWIADYTDAENYLALFYSKNFSPHGPNYTHFSNPRFDALYERALQEVNETKRVEMYKEMDRILIEEAPVIVLYYDQVVRMVSRQVQNLGCNPMNLLTLKQAKVVE